MQTVSKNNAIVWSLVVVAILVNIAGYLLSRGIKRSWRSGESEINCSQAYCTQQEN